MEEKEKFIKEVVAFWEGKLLEDLEKVPEGWTERDIRWWLRDRAEWFDSRCRKGKHFREYKNDRLVKGI